MQNDIQEYCSINPSNIDLEHFTLSLINECIAQNIYTQKQAENTQLNLMTMLSEHILYYTKGESSSVKVEIAEGIFASMLYCCDFYLLSLPSIKQAIVCLEDVRALHKDGLDLIKAYIKQSKILLENIKQTKLPIRNIAYNSTIDKSFDSFFSTYNARFEAQNTFASIDYPLLFDNMSQTGIIYIKNYLQKLQLENEFCRQFSINDINCFLASYGVKYKLSSDDLLENIVVLLLRNALCATLLGKREVTLFITTEECNLLENDLTGLSEMECRNSIAIALSTLLKRVNASPELTNYITPYVDIICPQIMSAVKSNQLHNLILV